MGNCASTFKRLLSTKKAVKIVMVGLQVAGKTTILNRLKLGELAPSINPPTRGFNVESIEYNKINFTIWDVSGHVKVRPLWIHFFENAQGLIFVVDCWDREGIVEARDELQRILSADEWKDVVLLVLANRQDMPGAMTTAEVADKLGLHTLRERKWHIQGACATSGEGLHEGLDWLSTQLGKT